MHTIFMNFMSISSLKGYRKILTQNVDSYFWQTFFFGLSKYFFIRKHLMTTFSWLINTPISVINVLAKVLIVLFNYSFTMVRNVWCWNASCIFLIVICLYLNKIFLFQSGLLIHLFSLVPVIVDRGTLAFYLIFYIVVLLFVEQ